MNETTMAFSSVPRQQLYLIARSPGGRNGILSSRISDWSQYRSYLVHWLELLLRYYDPYCRTCLLFFWFNFRVSIFPFIINYKKCLWNFRLLKNLKPFRFYVFRTILYLWGQSQSNIGHTGAQNIELITESRQRNIIELELDSRDNLLVSGQGSGSLTSFFVGVIWYVTLCRLSF